LLELQRANPCLLAPGSEQIDVLLDAIACLQLSIQDEDGSFVFASNSDYNDTPCDTSVYSDDFNSIKTIPSAVWLYQSAPVKEQPSIFNHLLSLPRDAYLASSWPSSCETTVATTPNQSFRRNSMFSHLLCMPIDSFKSSSNTCASIEINNNKNSYVYFCNLLKYLRVVCEYSIFNFIFRQSNVLPTTEGTIKSVLDTGADFSKEFWLRNSQNAPCNYEISCYA
jgi:hypothetical protein